MVDLSKHEMYNLISELQRKKLSEYQILRKLIYQLQIDYTVEKCCQINEALHWHGYSSVLKMPSKGFLKVDMGKYSELVSNVNKSDSKTKELCEYLIACSNYRLLLISLNRLKISRLTNIGYISKDSIINDMYSDCDLYNAYFDSFMKKDDNSIKCKEEIENVLIQLGYEDVKYDYSQFRMSVEYLLWTITKKIKKNPHIKINTLKVIFSITKKEYLTWNGKCYFDECDEANAAQYIELIDKNAIKDVKSIYSETIEKMDDTGYKNLFKVL